MKARAVHHSRSLANAGSFWTETLRPADRPVVAAMSRTALVHGALSHTADRLQAGLQGTRVPLLQVPFTVDLLKITPMGGDMAARTRIVTDGFELVRRPWRDNWTQRGGAFAGQHGAEDVNGVPLVSVDGTQDFMLFPGGDPTYRLDRADWLQQPTFVVPVPESRHYEVLQTPSGRLLVAGVDFYRGGFEALVFREDPRTLFPDGAGVLVSGWDDPVSLYSQALGVDTVPGPHIWRWVRGSAQSPAAFAKAIAEAAGLTVVPEDAVVTARYDLGQGCVRYLAGNRILEVPYLHTALAVGSTLAAGDIIGNGVSVYAGSMDSAWYRALEWTSGLSLDTLCPVQGVTVPDRVVTAEIVSAAGGHNRLELVLDGTDDALEDYWTYVRATEDLSGFYLADMLLALEDIGDQARINALDFYMTSMLAEYLMVVDLRLQDVSELLRKRALAFIDRARPSGHVVMIRDV